MQHAHSAAGRLSIRRGRGRSPQGCNSAIRQPIRFSPRVTLRLGRAARETDATGGGDRGGHLLLRLRTAHEVLRAAHPDAHLALESRDTHERGVPVYSRSYWPLTA